MNHDQEKDIRSLTCKLVNLLETSNKCQQIRNILDQIQAQHTKKETKKTQSESGVPFWRRGVCILLVLTLAQWYWLYKSQLLPTISDVYEEDCLLTNSVGIMEFSRLIFDCSKCANITRIPQVRDISRMEFTKNYAYRGIPVLVKNATDDWDALKNFEYDWFRKNYDSILDAYEVQESTGQFFPYKTEFESLEEALHMPLNRTKRPWYFGWSNAHKQMADILRSQYNRPYFLPDDSESSEVDWIFMGTSGKGAMVHLDHVNRPSWQAQVKGRKTWYLFPSAECENICQPMNVTIETGDIFVIDTNIWFHSTFIHPGNISITIGSEYD